MSDFTISLVCCTQVIQNEIAQGVSQKSVGLTYAMAMVSESRGDDAPDWKAINAAIMAKWGFRGLERVKRRAWRLIEGKEQP